MITPQKIVGAVLGLWLLALTGFHFLGSKSVAPDLGAVSNNLNRLLQGNSWLTSITYFGSSQQTKIDSSGNITNTGSSAFHTLLGTLLTNELVQSAAGFSLTLSTANGNTQRLTAAQFCSAASVYIPMTSTTTLTIVLPAATSTIATCGALGGFSTQLIDNESSSVVTIATTSGEVAKQGIQILFASSTGATGSTGGTYPMTATGIAIAATSTLYTLGQYTGTSTANPTLDLMNIFYRRQ